jgi:hypothetical protein
MMTTLRSPTHKPLASTEPPSPAPPRVCDTSTSSSFSSLPLKTSTPFHLPLFFSAMINAVTVDGVNQDFRQHALGPLRCEARESQEADPPALLQFPSQDVHEEECRGYGEKGPDFQRLLSQCLYFCTTKATKLSTESGYGADRPQDTARLCQRAPLCRKAPLAFLDTRLHGHGHRLHNPYHTRRKMRTGT